ncbi:transposase [Streptomyces sp. NPDC058470]|uniref:transposase n=1 Tax=Streptomyces sp. NPDC058470 TaxID=3346515 RepID=UPI003652D51D
MTDLPSTQASPQQLGELARSHWDIENRPHCVRGSTFAEDAGRIRTGRGPENMAALRNLAVSTLRRAGHQNIAAALRHVSYQPFTRPPDLLGIS